MSNDDYDDTLAAIPGGEIAALTPSQAFLVVVRG